MEDIGQLFPQNASSSGRICARCEGPLPEKTECMALRTVKCDACQLCFHYSCVDLCRPPIQGSLVNRKSNTPTKDPCPKAQFLGGASGHWDKIQGGAPDLSHDSQGGQDSHVTSTYFKQKRRAASRLAAFVRLPNCLPKLRNHTEHRLQVSGCSHTPKNCVLGQGSLVGVLLFRLTKDP